MAFVNGNIVYLSATIFGEFSICHDRGSDNNSKSTQLLKSGFLKFLSIINSLLISAKSEVEIEKDAKSREQFYAARRYYTGKFFERIFEKKSHKIKGLQEPILARLVFHKNTSIILPSKRKLLAHHTQMSVYDFVAYYQNRKLRTYSGLFRNNTRNILIQKVIS